MNVDRYTKCVLTVIAACLLWICIMGSGSPLTAQTRQRPLTASNVQPVILVGTGSMDSAGTVTVNFVPAPGAREATDPTVPVTLSYSATKPLPVSLPYSASKPIPAQLTYSPREPLPVEIASVKKTGEWEPLRASVEDAPLRRLPGIGRQ
jgi:hypothetical protein